MTSASLPQHYHLMRARDKKMLSDDGIQHCFSGGEEQERLQQNKTNARESSDDECSML
jgi:hypothetical protein